jgi:hypothetical protein
MNTAALKIIFESVGWGGFREEEYPKQIARAREILATGGGYPRDREAARLIVAAIEAPAPGAAPALAVSTTPAPASHAEPPEPLLGLMVDGTELTVADFRAAGKDPLVYLKAEGATLTAIGRKVLESLEAVATADPLLSAIAKAEALKIDVAASNAYAAANKLDPMKCLKAAVETEEQLKRDSEFMAFPLGFPR